MTNTSGSVVWKTDYKPFGEEQSITGTIENNEKFAGKEKDKETGLYYFGARYMGSKIGRFITVDPIGPVNSRTGKVDEKFLLNPQKLNFYSYSLNNPYRYIDPDGKVIEVIGKENEKKIIQRDMQKLKGNSPTAKLVLEKLEKSKEIIYIKITKDGNSYNITENMIEYNPDKKYIYSGKEKWHWRDPEIGLGHEAIHSLHDIENNLGSTREIEESKTVGIGKFSKEPFTENKIRSEYGIERRPEY